MTWQIQTVYNKIFYFIIKNTLLNCSLLRLETGKSKICIVHNLQHSKFIFLNILVRTCMFKVICWGFKDISRQQSCRGQ